MSNKWGYLFEEGNADMRNLLGGKGANLAEMTNLGLPIPQGFTVTTEACTEYYNSGKTIPQEVQDQIFEALADLEKKQGKKFGDTENPLLVSVRSGARASMPGMMDTILNLGLQVEDVKKAAAHLKEIGLVDEMPSISEGRLGRPYFFIKDPDGIFVEIISAG